jgi:serine/threonine-protein kinase
MSDDPIHRLNAALEDRYRIERELGEGGMATVYLADDLKHERRVALKVLKPELAAVVGAERFLTEIRTTANLQHPHILPLFDSGEANGLLFYVMPYVEGETLRERLDRQRQLPVEDAVRITANIAEALDYAHRQGVIHRDIKPANVLLVDGKPVISDFGIALAVGAAGGSRLTETGLSVGTPHYMSPEQATGDEHVGPATDIYALGCVLYEMLVGEPPFTGSTPQAVLGKIIKGEADFLTEHRPTVPQNVELAVAKALERVPADRFASGADLARALRDTRVSQGPRALPRPRGWRDRAHLGLTGLLAVVVVWLVAERRERGRDAQGNRVELSFRTPDPIGRDLTFTSDGRAVLLSQERAGTDWHVYRRRLDNADFDLVGTGSSPSASPDGRWVVLVNPFGNELQKAPVEGGTPTTLATGVQVMTGSTWAADGRIVYAPNVTGGLWAIDEDGGAVEQITEPDRSRGELGHWHPYFLPDGEHLLFTNYRPPLDSSSVEVLHLPTGDRTRLVSYGVDARYVETGHLVFMRRETLWAVPFDPESLSVLGPESPILEGVAYDVVNAKGVYALSHRGDLAYVQADNWYSQSTLVWIDRDGRESPAVTNPGAYRRPRISPDGSRIAVEQTVGGQTEIWVYEIGEDVPRRVTRDLGLVSHPVWTADGRELLFSLERPQFDLYRVEWDVVNSASELNTDPYDKHPWSVSADGRLLALMTITPTSRDIVVGSLDGEFQARPFHASEHDEWTPAISPDGRWIAYTSDEGAERELWVAPYPEGSDSRRRRRIGIGLAARWAGSEIAYFTSDGIMSVPVDLASGTPGDATVRYSGPWPYSSEDWDLSADGERLLILKEVPSGLVRSEVTVILGFAEQLERLASR